MAKASRRRARRRPHPQTTPDSPTDSVQPAARRQTLGRSARSAASFDAAYPGRFWSVRKRGVTRWAARTGSKVVGIFPERAGAGTFSDRKSPRLRRRGDARAEVWESA